MLAELASTGKVVLSIDNQIVELDSEDIEVRLLANEGWAAAQGKNGVVILSTELTPALLREGMARDIVRMVQDRRKELQLDFTDRIALGLQSSDAELLLAIIENVNFIKQETLAIECNCDSLSGEEEAVRDVAGITLSIFVKVVS